MPLKNAEVVSVLNDLIETSEDGIRGFQTASDAVSNPAAKALFASRLPNIQRGASELKAEVRRLGGDPEKRGTMAGDFHRAWINLKSAVTGKNEDAVVMECERGEEHAAHVYEDALQKDLPLDTRAIVERQYRGVVENLDRVRALSGNAASTPASTSTATPASTSTATSASTSTATSTPRPPESETRPPA